MQCADYSDFDFFEDLVWYSPEPFPELFCSLLKVIQTCPFNCYEK